jgi:hypothetical protein
MAELDSVLVVVVVVVAANAPVAGANATAASLKQTATRERSVQFFIDVNMDRCLPERLTDATNPGPQRPDNGQNILS